MPSEKSAAAVAIPASADDWQSLLDQRDYHIGELSAALAKSRQRAANSDLLKRIRLLAKQANGDIHDLAWIGTFDEVEIGEYELRALRTVNRIIELIDGVD